MKKILWIGDGVAPTGFSTVNHNIIKYLPEDEFEVTHLAVNYYGDPHEYKHKIYPASRPEHFMNGDMLGYNRIPEFKDSGFDIIFILNDIWVIDRYLQVIKDVWKDDLQNLPEIVVYFPVDGEGYTQEWFMNFDVVSQAVVYTEFGKRVVLEAMPTLDIKVIPHGARDKSNIFKIEDGARTVVYPSRPDLQTEDSFIVANVNRNQPRKRIDIALLGFALFAKDKPDNVMYFHHAGIKDVGWHLIDLIRRIESELKINLQKRIVLSNAEMGPQQITIEELNRIYNATDVGINTSLGEGWGLTSTEHGSIGVPQIVGDHTACKELFEDVGLLIPVTSVVRDPEHLLKRYFVSAEGLAEQLEKLYTDKVLYKELSEKSMEKFSSPYFDWEEISKKWVEIFRAL